MATDINKKPDQNVINLSSPNPVANKGTTYRVTWGLTAHARDANNPARTTVVDVWWDVHLRSSSDRTKTRKLRAKQSYTGLSASMSAELNVSAFASAEPRASWSSADFYPQGDWLIERVVVYAHARNPKGEQPWLPSSRTLEPPRKPTVTDLAQGEGTGVVSFRATRAAGNAPNHARDVYATIAAYDSRVGGGKSPVAGSERSRESGTDVTLSYDVADFASMDYSDWVRVDAAAWDRGVSGNSDEVKKSLYVSWPAKPTVTGVRATSADSTGKLAVLLKTNATAQHPTTGMRLECARDVDWESASDVVGGYWEDAGVEDNGSCTALSVAVAEVAPAAGKTSWVRVKAWNQHESVFYRYSEPVRLSMLENPAPAADDPVAIVSTAPGADGASLDVTLAWDPDGTDDSDATELAWATDPLAWRSNQGPDSYAFSWDDGPLEVGGASYLHSARGGDDLPPPRTPHHGGRGGRCERAVVPGRHGDLRHRQGAVVRRPLRARHGTAWIVNRALVDLRLVLAADLVGGCRRAGPRGGQGRRRRRKLRARRFARGGARSRRGFHHALGASHHRRGGGGVRGRHRGHSGPSPSLGGGERRFGAAALGLACLRRACAGGHRGHLAGLRGRLARRSLGAARR